MPNKICGAVLAVLLAASCASAPGAHWTPAVSLLGGRKHAADVRFDPANPNISGIAARTSSRGIELGVDLLTDSRSAGGSAPTKWAHLGFRVLQGEIEGRVTQVVPGGVQVTQPFGWDFTQVGVMGRYYLPKGSASERFIVDLSPYVTAGIVLADVEYRSSSELFDVLGPQLSSNLGIGIEATLATPAGMGSGFHPSLFLEATDQRVLSESQDIQGLVKVDTTGGLVRFGLRFTL